MPLNQQDDIFTNTIGEIRTKYAKFKLKLLKLLRIRLTSYTRINRIKVIEINSAITINHKRFIFFNSADEDNKLDFKKSLTAKSITFDHFSFQSVLISTFKAQFIAFFAFFSNSFTFNSNIRTFRTSVQIVEANFQLPEISQGFENIMPLMTGISLP